MDSKGKLPLALTCGDPSGIGPEVITDALEQDSLFAKDCCLIGPESWAKPLADRFGIEYKSVGPERFLVDAGNPSIESASVAFSALEAAAIGCAYGLFRGVVTGPVSKLWLEKVGFKHPGQTEFFATSWGGEPSMAFVSQSLRVVLATWHIPLAEVPRALTVECLTLAIRRAAQLALNLGVENPKIGVCGINPHAGEGGLLGSEEGDILNPALRKLQRVYPGLSECLPGDTVFYRQRKGDFDVVVAAYHDQGLVAVKTLEFDRAVNVTLGLPYVRTSPDHGTAYDLAGKGGADCGSFLEALQLARKLTSKEI
ncbi:MAG: 4-hydroxythreonine-4-phosphate dehydrogenase [Opitutia bacterium UBA7350]|nr:MAG: 4-hydroxythreonine-4-phosphate dehydrogenase [Opitutae bacterium UBA7350]